MPTRVALQCGKGITDRAVGLSEFLHQDGNYSTSAAFQECREVPQIIRIWTLTRQLPE